MSAFDLTMHGNIMFRSYNDMNHMSLIHYQAGFGKRYYASGNGK